MTLIKVRLHILRTLEFLEFDFLQPSQGTHSWETVASIRFNVHRFQTFEEEKEKKLDLSKLCEFCIKSCAERRKMTTVN